MPVPKEILAVERPTNTVVVAYGKNKDRYAVRKRVGCRNVGGRHVPVTGPTVGHIVGGRYVAKEAGAIEPVSRMSPQVADWAGPELASRLTADVLDDLRAHFAPRDAERIWCMALLRTCRPGVRDCELKDAYEESVLARSHPGVALSRNAVSAFLSDLGGARGSIAGFMRERAARVGAGHTVLVDGTLKSDESRVNTLSDFSRKARAKGTRDISLVYAFDLEAGEPVCSQCFPGNMLDLTAYEAFVSQNAIRRGLIVADKGFPSSAARGWFEANPDLHFLNPLKRNAKVARELSMLDFEGVLPSAGGIACKRAQAPDGRWLYSFRDPERACREERGYLAKAGKKGSLDPSELRERRPGFGSIVLESDLEMDVADAYRAYAERWEIELVMRYYKSALELDETRVHSDDSVVGSELVDFVASLATFRLLKAFDGAGLLEKMTYGKVMKVLARARQVEIDGEWVLVRTSPSQLEVLRKLGLLPQPEEPPKRKRGRPRKASV